MCTKFDSHERELLRAVEQGELRSVATASELARVTAAARSTSLLAQHFKDLPPPTIRQTRHS